MSSNKRHRTKDSKPSTSDVESLRLQQLRLCDELATKLGTRYCTQDDLITMMLSQKILSRASTFVVNATLMGDLNEWISITLDDKHASVADVKKGVEQAKGLRPAMQELFRYDETWTGTEGSGGSGHSAAQEDAALLQADFIFDGPSSVVVSVNELYDVVLEGLEEGDPSHFAMGVYERVEGMEIHGMGVWQALGGVDRFLDYFNDGENTKQWILSNQQAIDDGDGAGMMFVDSTAISPEQITEEWQVDDSTPTGWQSAPKLRVRACSSVEKHAAVQRMEQDQERALAQAQQAHTLVHEGLEGGTIFAELMGVYKLMKGKVVNRRAVWQKQSAGGGAFLFYSSSNKWLFGNQESMELGLSIGFAHLTTTALTPDQARPSEVWYMQNEDEDAEPAFVARPEVRVRRQT
jgi:hypothetical protein